MGNSNRGPIAALLVTALLIGGCGGDDGAVSEGKNPQEAPDALARYAPPDAEGFGELVIKPSDEDSAAIDDLIDKFGDQVKAQRDELGQMLLNRTVASFDPEAFADGAPTLDYEDDVAPWLGDRVGGFVRVYTDRDLTALVSGGTAALESGLTESLVIADVSDSEAAADTLEQLFGPSNPAPSDTEGVEYFHGGPRSALLTDDVLLVGSENFVLQAVRRANTTHSLADSEGFRRDLSTVDDGALGFAIYGSRVVRAINLAQLDKTREEIRRAGLDALGLEPGRDATVSFASEDGAGTVDLSYPIRGDEHGLAEAARLLGQLPASSTAALADPFISAIFLDAYRAGVEIGFGNGSAEQRTTRALGYDPVTSLGELKGTAAAYIKGDELSDLELGVFLSADSPPGGPYAVDGARFSLANGFDASIDSGDLSFGGKFGFSATTSGPDGARLFVAQQGDRLGIVSGVKESELPQAFRPRSSLESSGRPEEIEADLGKGWTALGYADLGSLLGINESSRTEQLASDSTPQTGDDGLLEVGGRIAKGIPVVRVRFDPG